MSEILFREIAKKKINILTLESACEKLDIYYKDLGFRYDADTNNMFSSIIGTSANIMLKQNQ